MESYGLYPVVFDFAHYYALKSIYIAFIVLSRFIAI